MSLWSYEVIAAVLLSMFVATQILAPLVRGAPMFPMLARDPVEKEIARQLFRCRTLGIDPGPKDAIRYTAVLNTCPPPPDGGARARRRWEKEVVAHFKKYGYTIFSP